MTPKTYNRKVIVTLNTTSRVTCLHQHSIFSQFTHNTQPISPSVGYWLESWPCKAESAQLWWFEPNALSVLSGVTTLILAYFPEKHSVVYVWVYSISKCT